MVFLISGQPTVYTWMGLHCSVVPWSYAGRQPEVAGIQTPGERWANARERWPNVRPEPGSRRDSLRGTRKARTKQCGDRVPSGMPGTVLRDPGVAPAWRNISVLFSEAWTRNVRRADFTSLRNLPRPHLGLRGFAYSPAWQLIPFLHGSQQTRYVRQMPI